MEIDAHKTLRCPACMGELRLEIFKQEGSGGSEFVESGLLLCEPCRTAYPIESSTPVMLRFSTPFHERFAATHAARLQELSDYALPSGKPRPGEEAVQETFTDEWDLTRENELSFTYTAEQLVELNRQVWLSWLDELPARDRPRTVLNVGCGVGMETQALREVTGAEQLFAIDLNFALLSRRPEYRRQPGVNFVVASLFDLPFEREVFDMVYSQGVIHHTYSSSEAFASIAPRVRPGGHLFIWVYALEDHLAPVAPGGSLGWKKRHYAQEAVVRPIVSRSPRPLRNAMFKLMTAVSHMRWRRGHARLGRVNHGKRWKRENTEHALRDWLSPRYAHRHGFNEVAEWFETTGFRVVDMQSPAAYRDLFGIPMFGVGMTGQRVEGAEGERAETLVEKAHA